MLHHLKEVIQSIKIILKYYVSEASMKLGVVMSPMEGDHRGDLGVDGWLILGWISRRWDVGTWTGLGWPRIQTGGGCL